MTAEPRYRALLDDLPPRRHGEAWKALYAGEVARGHELIARLARHVPSFDPATADVLDAGAGDGGMAIAFAARGARVKAIDIDARSVERARVRAEEHGVSVDLDVASATALPFADASFDLVLLDNVLEHVAPQSRCLSEARRVLRPRGLLYLVTPKPYSLAAIVGDPHYALFGLVLLPRAAQAFYVEHVRRAGDYAVSTIPTRRQLTAMLRAASFTSLVSPRTLWMEYLRERLARPAALSTAPKRRLARWLERHPVVLDAPVFARWWDIALGANIFIAQRGDE